jgi:hypothetical protein
MLIRWMNLGLCQIVLSRKLIIQLTGYRRGISPPKWHRYTPLSR